MDIGDQAGAAAGKYGCGSIWSGCATIFLENKCRAASLIHAEQPIMRVFVRNSGGYI